MQSWMIVSSVTVYATGWLPVLPPAEFCIGALALSLVLVFLRPALWSRCLLGISSGLLYGTLWGGVLIEQRLPEQLEGELLQVQLRVLEPPQLRDLGGGRRRQRFAAELTLMGCPAGEEICPASLPRVLLSYYGNEELLPGEKWQAKVKLKRPWGLVNPGSFNYQAWLARNRFLATGYIREKTLERAGADTSAIWYQRWRSSLAGALRASFPDGGERGVLLALSNGDRSDISQEHWQLFQRYGLNHLVVISGLHVGLVAGVGFLLGGLFGRSRAHLGAALLALMYAAMAGFALPTVRALVMLATAQCLALCGRRVTAARTLTLALLVIALFDPLASHGAGFWLSFTAVGVIFYVRAMRPALKGWRLTLLLQFALSLIMGVIASFWYGGFGYLAPIANLVAVPVLGVWVAPLCLAAALISVLDAGLAQLLWSLAGMPVASLFHFDAWLANYSHSLWMSYRPGLAEILIFTLALVMLFAHRAIPLRWLGLFMLCMILFPQRPPLSDGALEFWVLDVGQGLAIVVASGSHWMVYDTGAGDPAGPNMASAVIVPFLQSRGVRNIDLLVLSHGDRDHASGVYTLHDNFVIHRTWYGEALFPGVSNQQSCRRGQRLELGLLKLEILHPSGSGEGNQQSCVLFLEQQGFRVLVPGDIESGVEHRLARELGTRLAADALVVPHHGSKTSSSGPFLRRVDPELAIVSRGYQNRFGHPHSRVLSRYRRLGVTPLDTGAEGAIRLRVENGKLVNVTRWREHRQYYWY
jgi:competence protein ComEC